MTRRMKAAGVENWTISHSFFARSRGFRVSEQQKDHFSLYNAVLSDEDILKIINGGNFVKEPPFLSEDELMDRSKSNVFLKIITMIQALYLIVQAIARRGQDLGITELELATIAFTLCALPVFVLWLRYVQASWFPTVEVTDISQGSRRMLFIL